MEAHDKTKEGFKNVVLSAPDLNLMWAYCFMKEEDLDRYIEISKILNKPVTELIQTSCGITINMLLFLMRALYGNRKQVANGFLPKGMFRTNINGGLDHGFLYYKGYIFQSYLGKYNLQIKKMDYDQLMNCLNIIGNNNKEDKERLNAFLMITGVDEDAIHSEINITYELFTPQNDNYDLGMDILLNKTIDIYNDLSNNRYRNPKYINLLE